MKTWYCFKIYTDGSVHMGAYDSEIERDEIFNRTYIALGDYIDTYLIGTVETTEASYEEAMDSIRMGAWKSYTQKV